MPVFFRDDEININLVAPQSVTDEALLAQYAALLNDEEAGRWRRFAFPADAHDFLVSHGFLRVVLSRYTGLALSAWRFSRNPYGRPEIMEPAEARSLCFSLSHTKGLVAVAVAHGRQVGVDVENIEREAPMEIAKTVFTPAEISALRALPAGEQRERFFALWTLKEAYAKARGMGHSLNFSEFAFDLEAQPQIRLKTRDGWDTGQWMFALQKPAPAHLMAVAYEGSHSRRGNIRTVDLTLLADKKEMSGGS